MKFRKKPVVVEAEQFLENQIPLPLSNHGPVVCLDDKGWCVTTIHGQKIEITYGDWIIWEGKDFFAYPCKPDIFEATYEEVNYEQQNNG